jgi:cytochrome c peroxidase
MPKVVQVFSKNIGGKIMERVPRRFNKWTIALTGIVFTGLVVLLGACSSSSVSPDVELTSLSAAKVPLSQVPVPRPATSDITDQAAAVRLGKALFWDIQAGGDGQTACATCHFQAGADARKTNTVNPGPDGIFQIVSGPGQLLGSVTHQGDDIVGSQGVVEASYVDFSNDEEVAADNCNYNGFHRQVTGRQAPPVVGAVFNRHQFWDGRANDIFNGLNPFGNTGNNTSTPLVQMNNSSLASQAVGPANNPVEMSCNGRTFNGATNSLAAKLLTRKALKQQKVDATDSVLGSYANTYGNGLTVTYQTMVTAAFRTEVATDSYNQFSNIFGQAVQAYEATLIPDKTPFDRYLAGRTTAITTNQKKGLDIFNGKGRCTSCHEGTEMSDATVSYFLREGGVVNPLDHDTGFHNIGSTPTANDPGRAGVGPAGVPWAQTSDRRNNGAFKTPQLRNVKLTAPYFVKGNVATLADLVSFYNQGGFFANPEKTSDIRKLGLTTTEQASLVDFLTNALTDCRVEKSVAPFDHPALPLPNGEGVAGVVMVNGNPVLAATGASGTGVCN